MAVPLSILDLAIIGPGESAREALLGSVRLAQRAEDCGYLRVWYAEHHNMSVIASSSPAVLIAHIASQTRTIRLGAGGVMLPNHAPLTIAEQFGTLATLHPGRIDLGLGRAPGSDALTQRALRREVIAAEAFPEDVLELQGYLSGRSRVEGVSATPGAGTNIPLYILGSSLFGARLAASLGLPYAFASHFAPASLKAAVSLYRSSFRPSAQLQRPYVIAGVNVLAADTEAEAQQQMRTVMRARVSVLLGRGRVFSDAEADAILRSPHGQFFQEMMQYSALGTPRMVREYLEGFRRHADADELIVAHGAPNVDSRLRSLEMLAEVWPTSSSSVGVPG